MDVRPLCGIGIIVVMGADKLTGHLRSSYWSLGIWIFMRLMGNSSGIPVVFCLRDRVFDPVVLIQISGKHQRLIALQGEGDHAIFIRGDHTADAASHSAGPAVDDWSGKDRC